MTVETSVGLALRLLSILAGIFVLYYLYQSRKVVGGTLGQALFWLGISLSLLMAGVTYVGLLYAVNVPVSMENEAIGPAFSLTGFAFAYLGFRKIIELQKA